MLREASASTIVGTERVPLGSKTATAEGSLQSSGSEDRCPPNLADVPTKGCRAGTQLEF